MTFTHWKYRKEPRNDLLNNTHEHPVVATLLQQRSHHTTNQINTFLYPNQTQCHDPFAMKDMEKAIDRLEQAIKKKEKTRIYGDYDADGICSVSLLYKILKDCLPALSYYIPDRQNEGYGLSLQSIQTAAKDDIQLLIVLDCGTRDLQATAAAKEQGIEIIICDHHVPGPVLPECHALLNPKQNNCNYPQKELSACAIGFKLMQAGAQQGILCKETIWAHSDIVAVSLVADQISLLGESRVLLSEGIMRLRQQPCPGLAALMDKMDVNPQHLNTETIAFQLAPPINATGRIAHAHESVKLLISTHKQTADIAAEALLACNLERKTVQQHAIHEALQQLQHTENAVCTFIYAENWHPGIIGIVAARCMELYPRPTIILSNVKQHIVGSMRSIYPINAHAALQHCAPYLTRFGGHRYAGGCSLLHNQLTAFEKTFTAYIATQSTGIDLRPVRWIDLPLCPTKS